MNEEFCAVSSKTFMFDRFPEIGLICIDSVSMAALGCNRLLTVLYCTLVLVTFSV